VVAQLRHRHAGRRRGDRQLRRRPHPRHLQAQGVDVVEVNRPNRQLRSLVSTAPEELRRELRDLSACRWSTRRLATGPTVGPTSSARPSSPSGPWPGVYVTSTADIAELDAVLGPLGEATAPDLMTRPGLGARHRRRPARGRRRQSPPVAQRGHLRPSLRRLMSRRLVGQAAPAPTEQRRRSRSQRRSLADRDHSPGFRSADPPLRRTALQGGTDRTEAIRCLKRYVAREVFFTSNHWLGIPRSTDQGDPVGGPTLVVGGALQARSATRDTDRLKPSRDDEPHGRYRHIFVGARTQFHRTHRDHPDVAPRILTARRLKEIRTFRPRK
jgi:hypothetical protein